MSIIEPFRPWGHLAFLLGQMRPRRWALLACLGSEARCLGSCEILHTIGALATSRLFEIADSPESRFVEVAKERRNERRREYRAMGGNDVDIEDHALFEPVDAIRLGVERFLAAGPTDVVFDVTSFPKRFFFPILRWLIQSNVKTLIATYTSAERYPSEPLSEDPEPATHLPSFAGKFPEPKVRGVIVGLGFQPLGLQDILQDAAETAPVHLLFAHPHHPGDRQRVWELVRNVSEIVAKRLTPLRFVSPRNVSEVFDHISGITDGLQKYTVMAPYGPKPMSLAMALAAAAAEWPAYYTQPKAYHPDYSIGILRRGGIPVSYGHCLRLDGRDLYTRP